MTERTKQSNSREKDTDNNNLNDRNVSSKTYDGENKNLNPSITFNGWGHFTGIGAHNKAHYIMKNKSLCGIIKSDIMTKSDSSKKCKTCLTQIERYKTPENAFKIIYG
jgi:hypothetical protein